MSSKIRRLLSFQVLHHIVNRIIFQIPRSQHPFILLLQAINKSLIVQRCTQLTPNKENNKCQSLEPENTPAMDKKVVHRFLLLKTHTASTRQVEISSLKHIFCRHFTFGNYQSQKASFGRSLTPPACVSGKSKIT